VKKIAIFGSGSGSNAENICSFFTNSSDIKVVLIGTNNKNAFIVGRAEKLQIPIVVFSKSELDNFDVLYKKLVEKEVEYIILAGFLLKIPLNMIENYTNKIINIHPSLLPKYSGKGMYGNNVHKAVLENKEAISGITIHLVNEKYDDGEVLFQKSCAVFSGETVASLSKKITKLEHLFFPEIIKTYIRR
jgi:phosphoribosylglycinamide formyltransferase-1